MMNTCQSQSPWKFLNQPDYPEFPDEEREMWLESGDRDEMYQIIMHDHPLPTLDELPCAADGCLETFQVVLYPEQCIYPRYCSRHRREYMRRHADKSFEAITP